MVNVPSYTLKTANGTISNHKWEFSEQKALATVLKDGDRLLQLGGNAGASCITADKVAKLSANVCVEPSTNILPILRDNIACTIHLR